MANFDWDYDEDEDLWYDDPDYDLDDEDEDFYADRKIGGAPTLDEDEFEDVCDCGSRYCDGSCWDDEYDDDDL